MVVAVMMHFTFCEWESYGSESSRIVAFVHAREQISSNAMGAAFWGMVVPTHITGSGIALIHKASENEGLRLVVRSGPLSTQ